MKLSPTLLLVSTLYLILSVKFQVGRSEAAPFAPCNGLTRVFGKDIQVDVSQCTSTERCPLYVGTSHNFTVKFGKLFTQFNIFLLIVDDVKTQFLRLVWMEFRD